MKLILGSLFIRIWYMGNTLPEGLPIKIHNTIATPNSQNQSTKNCWISIVNSFFSHLIPTSRQKKHHWLLQYCLLLLTGNKHFTHTRGWRKWNIKLFINSYQQVLNYKHSWTAGTYLQCYLKSLHSVKFWLHIRKLWSKHHELNHPTSHPISDSDIHCKSKIQCRLTRDHLNIQSSARVAATGSWFRVCGTMCCLESALSISSSLYTGTWLRMSTRWSTNKSDRLQWFANACKQCPWMHQQRYTLIHIWFTQPTEYDSSSTANAKHLQNKLSLKGLHTLESNLSILST